MSLTVWKFGTSTPGLLDAWTLRLLARAAGIPRHAQAVPIVIQLVLSALASHRVGQRPERSEPRGRTHRPMPYP